MGCCSSGESSPLKGKKEVEGGNSEAEVYLKDFSQKNVAKKYSEQIKKIKDLMIRLEKNIVQSEKSSEYFCEALSSLHFRFSEKPLRHGKLILQELECPICLEVYNKLDKRPKTLCCDHTICENCAFHIYSLENTIVCPIDGEVTFISPDECPLNQTILETLESLGNNLYCREHITPAGKFCTSCGKLICSKCEAEHETHSIKSTDDITLEDNFNFWAKNIEKYVEDLRFSEEELVAYCGEIQSIEEKIKNCVESYLSKTGICRDEITERIVKSSRTYVLQMDKMLAELRDSLPSGFVGTYKQALCQEIDKADEFSLSFRGMSLGEKLQIISQYKISGKVRVDPLEKEPWSGACREIENMTEYKELIASLASNHY